MRNIDKDLIDLHKAIDTKFLFNKERQSLLERDVKLQHVFRLHKLDLIIAVEDFPKKYLGKGKSKVILNEIANILPKFERKRINL